MIFDTDTRAENDPRAEIRKFWAGKVICAQLHWLNGIRRVICCNAEEEEEARATRAPRLGL
jgi:hypothetical protein